MLFFLFFFSLYVIHYFSFIRVTDTCSHSRAIEFYAESITDNNAFIGKCRNDCNDLFISMGYATPRNALV